MIKRQALCKLALEAKVKFSFRSVKGSEFDIIPLMEEIAYKNKWDKDFLSLGGRLTLELRKSSSNSSGEYNLTKKKITVHKNNKTEDFLTFMHEWFHALDNWLGLHIFGKENMYLSYLMHPEYNNKRKIIDIYPEGTYFYDFIKSFEKIMKVISCDNNYMEACEELDRQSGLYYMNSPIEHLARNFEAYIVEKMDWMYTPGTVYEGQHVQDPMIRKEIDREFEYMLKMVTQYISQVNAFNH